MASTLRLGLSNFKVSGGSSILFNCTRSFYVDSCLYRAKKSTRERKFKEIKKRKAEKAAALLRKGPYIPPTQKKTKDGETLEGRRKQDIDLEPTPDDVWIAKDFKFRVFSFEEAANCIREVFHPSMYNVPDAILNAYIELDMSTDKRTKFYDGFIDVATVRHPYDHHEDRSILAFAKAREDLDAAGEAGATLAGGSDTIRLIKRGKIMLPDFPFVVAHPSILPEMTVIRGLLRKKFPSVENRRLGMDLAKLIKEIRTGTRYEAKRDEFEMDYGWIEVGLGPLTMSNQQLEENLADLINDIKTKGPKRKKNMENYRFVTRCYITSALHDEKLLINVDDYLGEEEEIESDDEDEVAQKAKGRK